MAELLIGDSWTHSHSKELVPVKMVEEGKNINELPNEILDRVFRSVDQESLQQLRLVCTKWDVVALKIMSLARGKVTLGFEKDAGINEKGLEDIGKLHSILKSSKYPGIFFSELSLESPNWNDYKKGVLAREMELLDLLEKFGTSLKSLELKGITIHLSIFRPLIDKWCANLEELKFVYITVVQDDSMNVKDFETLPTPLELNLRKFTVCDESWEETEAVQNLNFFLAIIKSSPRLISLEPDIILEEPDFWIQIQNLPHITRNLEELKVELRDEEELSLISDISLSDKLRSLSLTIGFMDPTFPKEPLVKYLQTVGESLEQLCLQYYCDDEDEVDEASSLSRIRLPSMNKLKVLKYISAFQISFNPMDFLEKLPSLETLDFQSEECDVLYMDTFFLNCSYLTRRPQTTLTTLSIGGSPERAETIAAINRMFPNLRELSLVLDNFEIPNETMESWLMSVFQEFSEMRNLKVLSINFRGWFEEDARNAGINFRTCFSPLEASQSLEKLTMLSDSRRHSCPMCFPPGLEKIFARIPKLKVMTLEGWLMKKLSDAGNLFKTLDQKGILINLL